eukprot:PhF_6_TR42943/c0_g1_i1/m.65253
MTITACGVLVGTTFDVIEPSLTLFRTTSSTTMPSWIRITFHSVVVWPSHYTLCVTKGSGHRPKSWIFQGSPDGRNWNTLDSRSDESVYLQPSQQVTWPVTIPSAASFFRYFQVVQ